MPAHATEMAAARVVAQMPYVYRARLAFTLRTGASVAFHVFPLQRGQTIPKLSHSHPPALSLGSVDRFQPGLADTQYPFRRNACRESKSAWMGWSER